MPKPKSSPSPIPTCSSWCAAFACAPRSSSWAGSKETPLLRSLRSRLQSQHKPHRLALRGRPLPPTIPSSIASATSSANYGPAAPELNGCKSLRSFVRPHLYLSSLVVTRGHCPVGLLDTYLFVIFRPF